MLTVGRDQEVVLRIILYLLKLKALDEDEERAGQRIRKEYLKRERERKRVLYWTLETEGSVVVLFGHFNKSLGMVIGFDGHNLVLVAIPFL